MPAGSSPFPIWASTTRAARLRFANVRFETQARRGIASSSTIQSYSSRPQVSAKPQSSVHPSEIAHFSRLSSAWWDEHGEFGLLHAMNPVRVQFMREKMQEVRSWEEAVEQVRSGTRKSAAVGAEDEWTPARFLEGLDVVDVGCGGGLLSESLVRLGARTTGIDASQSNIGIAQTHASTDPMLSRPHSAGGAALTYRHTTAEDLRAEGRTFDMVCAMEVVEHVNGPAEFLRTLADLVKPGGHLFMSTISRTPLSYFLTILMAEHVLRLVTPGTHTHSQYIRPDELVNFFRDDLRWFSSEPQSQLQSQSQSPSSPPSSPAGNEGGRGQTRVPSRLQFETRGTAYLPWKSAWVLAPRGAGKWGAEECNYFFWARKPLS